MSRYKNTKIKNDIYSNNRVLRVTEYPKITPKESDVVYYTRFDDSYMSLAHRYYNDQSLWWVIARANSPFKGKFKFEAGTKLIIPTDISDVMSEMYLLNSTREIPDSK